MKVAWFLYDYTGLMAEPWLLKGYKCYIIDIQHDPGIKEDPERPGLFKVGLGILPSRSMPYLMHNLDTPSFIFGFPPCTDLAVCGARAFAKKRDKNPEFQDEAMAHVYFTRDLAASYNNCTWAIENPISVISTKWKTPDFYFHPFEYGGYLPVDDVHPEYPDYINSRDSYRKKTSIWHSHDFVEPVRIKVPVDEGYSKQYKKLGGSSLKTKNIRSATPRGFALAVCKYNC